MERKILKNKPFVETVFELRWKFQEPALGIKIDLHYKIMIGRIYDRVKDEYPLHEQLPTANMPDEIAGHVVQHHFREGKDKWPLIQIGPGIIALDDTEGYVWKDFQQKLSYIINVLFDTCPDAESNLKINRSLIFTLPIRN